MIKGFHQKKCGIFLIVLLKLQHISKVLISILESIWPKTYLYLHKGTSNSTFIIAHLVFFMILSQSAPSLLSYYRPLGSGYAQIPSFASRMPSIFEPKSSKIVRSRYWQNGYFWNRNGGNVGNDFQLNKEILPK